MTRGFSRGRFGLAAVVAALGAATIPALASAATSGTASLPLTGGTLSLTGVAASASLPSTSVAAGTVSGALNSGTWSDTTGTFSGWHGTIQLTGAFVYQGAWAQTSGTATALSSTASGAYTGTFAEASLTVTVTASTIAATTVSWTDHELTNSSGSNTVCTAAVACAINNGVTITFAAAVYPTGAVYQANVGALPTTAMTLDSAGTTTPVAQGTTLGGTNLPVFENNSSTVPVGSGVAFLHATAGTGSGSFTAAPGVTVAWDPNNTWSQTFSTTAQYAIVAGP